MEYCNWEGKELCDLCERPKLVDFLLTDEAWKRIVGAYSAGVLCLHCLVDITNSKQLLLQKEDFIDIKIYNPFNADGLYFLQLND